MKSSEPKPTAWPRDERKVSLYFPHDLLVELKAEAKRQDRTMSWLIRRSWSLAKREIIAAYNSVDEEV